MSNTRFKSLKSEFLGADASKKELTNFKDNKTARLEAIAEKMKTAKGKELDALTAEVDRIIGFDSGDDKYDAERDASWQLTHSRKD